MRRSILSSVLAGIVITSMTLAHGPLVLGIEGGEGQGGGNEGSGSSESSDDTGGRPGNGGHSGHGTNVLLGIARWMARNNNIGNFPQGAFGGGETPLTEQELQFVCSMHRALQKKDADVRAVVIDEMSRLMSRPVEFIQATLENGLLCTPVYAG